MALAAHSPTHPPTHTPALVSPPAGFTLLTVIRSASNLLSALRASRVIHHGSLTSLVRAPVTFFDTTPVGRILNRFSKVGGWAGGPAGAQQGQQAGTIQMLAGSCSSRHLLLPLLEQVFDCLPPCSSPCTVLCRTLMTSTSCCPCRCPNLATASCSWWQQPSSSPSSRWGRGPRLAGGRGGRLWGGKKS